MVKKRCIKNETNGKKNYKRVVKSVKNGVKQSEHECVFESDVVVLPSTGRGLIIWESWIFRKKLRFYVADLQLSLTQIIDRLKQSIVCHSSCSIALQLQQELTLVQTLNGWALMFEEHTLTDIRQFVYGIPRFDENERTSEEGKQLWRLQFMEQSEKLIQSNLNPKPEILRTVSWFDDVLSVHLSPCMYLDWVFHVQFKGCNFYPYNVNPEWFVDPERQEKIKYQNEIDSMAKAVVLYKKRLEGNIANKIIHPNQNQHCIRQYLLDVIEIVVVVKLIQSYLPSAFLCKLEEQVHAHGFEHALVHHSVLYSERDATVRLIVLNEIEGPKDILAAKQIPSLWTQKTMQSQNRADDKKYQFVLPLNVDIPMPYQMMFITWPEDFSLGDWVLWQYLLPCFFHPLEIPTKETCFGVLQPAKYCLPLFFMPPAEKLNVLWEQLHRYIWSLSVVDIIQLGGKRDVTEPICILMRAAMHDNRFEFLGKKTLDIYNIKRSKWPSDLGSWEHLSCSHCEGRAPIYVVEALLAMTRNE